MAGIFISYRREDSAAVAGRLFDRLSQHFGQDKVFRDVDTIDPGAEFGKVIAVRIAACDALIALIGEEWLYAKDAEGRRRLDQPGDFVRAEISEALAQNKLVIPALIEGVTMPSHDALPPQIAGLADRNAVPISDSRFDFDVGRLIDAIEKVVAPRAGATTSATQRGLWTWLSKAWTQRTLAFFGAGLAAVVGAGWTAYVYFATKPEPAASTVSASQGGIAAGGSVSATASPGGVAVVATGPVTIGITLAEYEAKLKKREQELREEFASTSKADKEKIALLEAQLKDAEAKAKSPADDLKEYKQVLASASQSLERIPGFSAENLERAQQALARGDTREAERLFESVPKGAKERPEAAYQVGKLAESRIDYAKADKYYLEAVKLQPDNAQYLEAAGKIARTLGRYAEAHPLLERALATRKKSLGPDHPDVAGSLNSLALVYDAQGLYAKAEPLFQESLAIFKKSLGPDHPDVAATLNNLALVYRTQGLYAKAEPLFQESLAIRKKSLGPNHADVAGSLNNLGMVYYAQALYAKAEPLFQESVAIWKSLRPDHPDAAKCLNNLAALYHAQGLYAKAEPLYQESLAIFKKSLGPDHPDVAATLNNLAVLYRDQRLYVKAEPLYQHSLTIRNKSLGSDHPDVAQSLNNLAQLYQDQGLYAKAEPLYKEALAIRKKSLGTDHPNVAETSENYAELLVKLKRETEAADLQSQAKEIRARLAGR